MQNVTVVDHPLVQHKLTLMRDMKRSTKGFRQLLNEIGMLLCYEVTRDLALEMIDIETPLQPMKAPVLAGKKLVFAPILRAGVGFLDGMLSLVPSARVAHVGLYRDPKTLVAVEYYFKAPEDVADRAGAGARSDAGDRQFGDRGGRPAEGGGRKEHPRSCACSPHPRASRNSTAIIPTCTSGPRRSTKSSTITATSCRAWATPATACTGRNDAKLCGI